MKEPRYWSLEARYSSETKKIKERTAKIANMNWRVFFENTAVQYYQI